MKNTKGLRRDGSPGHRGAGGRPKDKWVAFCKSICQSKKTQKFLRDMIEGNPVEEKVIDTPGHDPVKLLVAAPTSARIKALELVSAYGFGKPEQSIEIPELTKFVLNFPKENA
jgi:hypothetical protein